MNYVIGCGGVGSWLVPKLTRLAAANGEAICLVDGDTLEFKNLDRQLFDESDLGKNKAEALAAKYGVDSDAQYFSNGSIDPINRRDVFFCCADNHTARRAVLEAVDRFGCTAIIGANEYTDAEAYIYKREWKGTAHDPRLIYPAILTDDSDDPLRPLGCTGEAADATPQLVLANDWASGLMLHLYWYHTEEAENYPQEYWPIHERVSFAKFSTIKWGDRA